MTEELTLRWFPELYNQVAEPLFMFKPEYNLYYAAYGPENTMSCRPHPPAAGVNPEEIYDFAQIRFTWGDAFGDEGTELFQIWDLDGNDYTVKVSNGILVFDDGLPLQPQDEIGLDYAKGTQEDMSIPDGVIIINSIQYDFLDGKPTTPLQLDVKSGSIWKQLEKIYCYREINSQDLELSFPGSAWSLRPISYHQLSPLVAATYADGYWDQWFFPIPFPYTTHSNDKDVVADNGYSMLERVPQGTYNRSDYRWEGTFPMAHDIDTPLAYGLVRADPIVVKLRKRYRMHYKEF